MLLCWLSMQHVLDIERRWPATIYLFLFFAGAVGILWFFAWIFLAYSSPATHPRISKKEREYIESSIMESVEQVCWNTLNIMN